MIPDQTFLPNPVIHLPKTIRRTFISHGLQFVNHDMIIAMTLVVINRSGQIYQFTGPTEADLVRVLKMINTRPFLSGP
jgi:hypothetical protein